MKLLLDTHALLGFLADDPQKYGLPTLWVMRR